VNETVANALLAIVETSRDALRRQEPDAETPVEQRYTEIVEALQWLLDQGNVEAACRLAIALVSFWISTNRIPEGDEWFQRLLAVPRPPDEALALALYEHGYLVFWAGDYELAKRRFTESRDMAAALANPTIQALALAGLARVALNSDANEAVRLLRDALDLTDTMPADDPGRSSTMHVLGVALQMSGDLEGARDVITQRLELARQEGNSFVVWTESANLSMVERQLGNLDRAEELSRQAITTDIASGRDLYLGWTLNGLAAVTAAKGELTRAATMLAAAESLLQRAGGEWPPDEREQFDETQAIVRRGVTPQQLEAARAAGAAMSRDEVLSYAVPAATA
jgi:tetratricopeptide (TPR) repeat protein